MREGKAIALTAKKLSEDYDANLFNADKKYKGKVVELTGTVERVDKDRLGKPWLQITVDSDARMKCEFAKGAQPQLEKVEAGKMIKIRGRCKGKIKGRDGDEIVIENCMIVSQ